MVQPNRLRLAVHSPGGLGTRFLHAIKSVPKEMMTDVNKPGIHYVVDKAIEADIEHLVFATGQGKIVIEGYLDIQFEWEQRLKSRNKNAELSMVDALQPTAGETNFTRQREPLDVCHAVWCARHIVGCEPLAMPLLDTITSGQESCLNGMFQLYEKMGVNFVAMEECAPHHAQKHGTVGVGDALEACCKVTEILEEHAKGEAPSNFFINGRYVL